MLDIPTLHRRASRVLPASLRTRGVLNPACTPRELAALLLPLQHRHRGSLWFRLAEDTTQRLCEDTEAGLRDAQVARAGLARHAEPMQYQRWQVVATAPHPIYRTCSRDRRACLWLLPTQALLVYAWDDAMPPAPPALKCRHDPA